MKRLLLITCAIAASAAAAKAADAPDPATLRWTNGESITGDLVEATGTSASWKSSLFGEPVVLSWDVIHRIDWANTPAPTAPLATGTAVATGTTSAPVATGATTTTGTAGAVGAVGDPFIFTLRDGSSLYGDITAITGSAVFISGSRCGVAELKRSEVLSARRIAGDALILAGPTGADGWSEMNVQQDGSLAKKTAAEIRKSSVAGISVGPRGHLQIPYWNRAAALPLPIPNPVDIDFRLHSSGRPNFRLSVDGGPGTALRIETWDDALVVTLPNEIDFQDIRKLDDTDREIALRFCWDWKTRHCMVLTPSGDLITEWQAPADDLSGIPGIALYNKGSDLSLDYIRIRKWDGHAPPKIDAGFPRLEMADGRIVSATVKSGSNGLLRLSSTGGQLASTLPLKNIDALFFSPDAPADTTAQATLTYADGTYLNGQITAIKDGRVTLATSFSAQPLIAAMDGLRLLFVNTSPNVAPTQVFAKLDQLKIKRMTLHGSFVSTGDATARWLPVGGLAPVTLAKDAPFEIIRYFPDDAKVAAAPALFYTRTGDVLPGNMHALDPQGVEFDSGITQATKLPGAALTAIQFGDSTQLGARGFNDPAWQVTKGDPVKVQRNGDSLEMEPGTAIGNAAAMQASDIRFTMKIEGNLSAIRLRMFCAGADFSKATSLLFATNGNQINCGEEGSDGQFNNNELDAVPPGGILQVHLAILDREVDLYLNGLLLEKYPIPPAARAGTGLIIEPAGVWGNSAQPAKLTAFSMTLPPGGTSVPDVAPDAKDQALTIPRFRRDDPPTHALIAPNGDVLRGEIEAATTENFGFRSGMEDLVVPRDRVKAVIWLGKPTEAQPSATPNPADQVLNQVIPGPISFGGVTLGTVTNWLQSSCPGLKFKLPKDKGPSHQIMIGGDTLASTLDKICSEFDLTYHIDENGVIVFESSGPEPVAASSPLIEKVYWLKPGSLPSDTPPDKFLAGKGIPFPKGATATWQTVAGQLTMRNTADNQALFAQLAASSLGGIIGSPTHWVILNNGARIGLAVDNFGKDTVSGWHPLYGRCTIPTSEIVAIQSFPPAPSAAMKSLQDWRPVYAPEPVLPEAGSDDTASIGKPAGEFKLSLLAGGKFDLAKQKGKIVVLDFWATWCGPCVRSLPELISTMSAFTRDRVTFVGVNEDEPADVIKQFLETRGWNLTVALDSGQGVGQQYGVDGIPHTVIIGPDGKVAWVRTGYTPGGEADVSKEVNLLLAPPPQAPPAPKTQSPM
jgi:peroxiredoxin